MVRNQEKSVELRRVGLCLDCQNARQMTSDRGSVFFRGALSESDPRFPKYPRLPVVECSGFARKPSGASE